MNSFNTKFFRRCSTALIVASAGVLGPAASGLSAQSTSVRLEYRHRPGEVMHIDSTVNEAVYRNGLYTHDAIIEESAVVETTAVDPDRSAALDATFRTVERISGLPGYVEWVSDESVRMTRDVLGRLTVPETATRPVLRDVPVFPDRDLAPGDQWTAAASEVHVFRIGEGLYGPYRGDFTVAYTHLGSRRLDGESLVRIGISYAMYIPIHRAGEPVRLVSGRSEAELLWDVAAGIPRFKSEDFEFFMALSDGSTLEFRGTQDVEYRVVSRLDRDEAAARIRRDLEHLPGIAVDPADDGVRIVLDDTGPILFAPESAEISADQRRRLEALRDALAAYGDRDVLISGHTADYGTAEGRRRLSTRRAAAVADLLFPGGREGPGRLYLRGRGSEEPVGSDEQNRRVEIWILD